MSEFNLNTKQIKLKGFELSRPSNKTVIVCGIELEFILVGEELGFVSNKRKKLLRSRMETALHNFFIENNLLIDS